MRVVLLTLCLIFAGPAAWAATLERAGIALDIPDLWTRQDQPGGTLLTYPYRRDNGGIGSARIFITTPVRGGLATTWLPFINASKAIASVQPLQHGEGPTWSGGIIRWEQRCCRIGQVRAETIHVGVEQAGTTELLAMILVDADRETQARVLDTVQAIARSIRPAKTKRGMPAPPEGAGGLDGLYTTVRSRLMPNTFGGMDFDVTIEALTFDRSGAFARDVVGDGAIAAHCVKRPVGCGLYTLHGGTIEQTETADTYGRVTRRTVPFAKSNNGTIEIDSESWHAKTPFPAGSTLDGTWRYQWASSGTTAFSSGGASVQKSLTLLADGHFRRTANANFAGSNDIAGTTTSTTVSSPRLQETGRYTLEDYRLTLMPDGKSPETTTIFKADSDDGMLVIGGANYLKAR